MDDADAFDADLIDVKAKNTLSVHVHTRRISAGKLCAWTMSAKAIGNLYRNLYSQSMKTTLDINDALLANAKALAARQQTSLTRLIEEGLQLRLRASRASRAPAKPATRKLPVFKGRGGLVAGIDARSNRSMLDAADDDA